MLFSDRASSLRLPGSSDTHHTLTHEEPRDPALGYQPKATYFVLKSMEAWAHFVATLDAIPEGDGTLLDNCLVMAHSETSEANTHSVVGLPFMIAGKAGGRMRTGLHISGVGESTSRVGLGVHADRDRCRSIGLLVHVLQETQRSAARWTPHGPELHQQGTPELRQLQHLTLQGGEVEMRKSIRDGSTRRRVR